MMRRSGKWGLGIVLCGAWVNFSGGVLPVCASGITVEQVVFTPAGLRGLGLTNAAVDHTLLRVGSVTSQGDTTVNGPSARSSFSVNGSGIKIGVISDSYNQLGGAAAGILSGDLPGPGNPNGFLSPVSVVNDDLVPGRTDEGRGMLEIVHDIAPGAELLFHSAFNNGPGGTLADDTIAKAIDALVLAGADVIIDDVALLNEPFYQDGPAAQAVTNAHAAGVAYFSAAGNSGTEAYEDNFNLSSGNFHDFNPGGGIVDQLLDFTVPAGGTVRIAVQWDDPFLSVGAPGVASDFDIGIQDSNSKMFVSVSVADQTGGADPWELVGVTNGTGATKSYALAIEHVAGSNDRQVKAIMLGSGTIVDDDDTNSPSVFGHSAATGGVAVAAHRYNNLSSVESFSSRGPVEILFDTLGNPINDERDVPIIAAPNGVDTSFFGSGDFDMTGFPNFFGTSAAAPHAGAVAALVFSKAADLGLSLSPDDVYGILMDSAVDIDLLGVDSLSGFGRIDAAAALALVPEPCSMGMVLLGMGLALARGRRRSVFLR